jgi:hypothetical protein
MITPRQSPKPLLSRTEQMLYGRLVRAFPGHVVLAQVALSRLVDADPSMRGDPLESVDFVVFHADFTPLAVVELKASALEQDLAERHRRKDALLCTAGIKVLRVSAVDLPREAALKSLIAALPIAQPAAPEIRRAS